VSSSIEMYFLGSTIPTLTSIFGEPMGGEPMGGEPMGGGGIQGTAYYQVGTSDADKSRLLTVFSSIEEIVQAVCFLEDTKILTSTGYVKIQDLRKSDKVKTLNDGFVSIKLIGKTQFLNNYDDANKANCLYKLSKSVFKDLTDDLYVTGLHPILVDTPVLKNNKELKRLNWMHKTTDGKHRLLSYMNDGAEALKEVKVVTIWDFVLINKDVFRNYGVYANGLLTESMDENCFIKYSNFH
jgi:hypothetical protein